MVDTDRLRKLSNEMLNGLERHLREPSAPRGISGWYWDHEDIQHMRKLVDAIDARWRDKFSFPYLWNLIRSIAKDALEEGERQEARNAVIDQFLESLEEFDEEWECIVGVEGLRLEIPQVEIGHVAFYPHNPPDGDLALMVGRYLSRVESEDEREARRALYEEALKGVKSYAKITVCADAWRAHANAIDQVELALSAIRCLAPSARDKFTISDDSIPPQLTVVGHSFSQRRLIFSRRIHPPTAPPIDAITDQTVKGFISYKLGTEDLEHLNELGLGEISEALKAKQPSDLQKKILRAVRWSGEARLSPVVDDAYVKNMIALETLLSYPDDRSITQRLREGAALLLGRNEAERKAIAGEIADLYGKRGRVVHSGRGVNIEDLRKLENYVTHCLAGMLRLGLRSDKEFRNWIETQRFTTSADYEPMYRVLFADGPVHF